MANVRQMLLFTFIFALVKFSCVVTLVAPPTQGRVVGGKSAAVNSAPFAVSFQQGGTHYCGGSIINQHWVVTAAHCLTSRSLVMNTSLVAGSIYVSGSGTTTQRRSVNYYVVHDLYLGGTSPYDIGLVYTKVPFTWTNAVAAITLPASGATASGSALLYGWGSTSTTNNAAYPSALQVANVPIINLKTCESVLGPKGSDVHTTNLCTGPLTGGVGICTSDSGGPLVQKANNKNILVGIVSWGKLPCGQSNSPSVFVQVSSFVTWITNNQVVASGQKVLNQ